MTSERPLTDYPRPSVAVDVAVLTVSPDEGLCVLAQPRREAPRGSVLPGSFLRQRETTADAVERTLRDKVHLTRPELAPRLLRVFSDPDRDRRAWTISIAHSVSVPHDELADAQGMLVPIGADGAPEVALLFDHREMVVEAVRRIRAHYEVSPDPHGLLPKRFTLTELRELHETILDTALRPDTFKRRMSDPHAQHRIVGVVDRDGTPVTRVAGPGRPAQLFRQAHRRPQTRRSRPVDLVDTLGSAPHLALPRDDA